MTSRRPHCRELKAAGTPATGRLLERLIATMYANRKRRDLDGSGAGGGAAAELVATADIDGRFDPRAYRYVEDAIAAAALPPTALTSDRAVDLRRVLPCTAEAYTFEFFRGLYAKRGAGGGRHASPGVALALIVPPFDESLVGVPSTAAARGTAAGAAHEARRAEGGASLDDPDGLADLSFGYETLPSDGSSSVRRRRCVSLGLCAWATRGQNRATRRATAQARRCVCRRRRTWTHARRCARSSARTT